MGSRRSPRCSPWRPAISSSRLPLAALTLAGLLLVPLLAAADHLPVRDPNDVPGPLDIRTVSVRVGDDLVFLVRTHAGWRAKDIWDRGFVLVYLDTFGDARADYYALVRSTGRRLEGQLFRDRTRRPDFSVGRIAAFKPSRRSVSIRVPMRKLRIGGTRLAFSWYAESLFTSGRCRRVCLDRAPDQGTVVEPLQPTPTPSVPSPTPTPSTSPSPTPSATASPTGAPN